jgi:ubiquinone/menaquinone biosynthesis C-methylase UbiE
MKIRFQFREWLFRLWYWYISNVDKKAEVLFMNYGFSSPDQKVDLHPDDEPNRYSIQLYHFMASSVDLSNKSILEVGCGRGGGLSYVARSFPVKMATGVDLNKRASRFSSSYYKIDGLKFQQGDAQNLNFQDNTFDAILNVESSHRYPDINAFFGEVRRLLRPGGFFLFTDFRYDYEMKELDNQMNGLGMKVVDRKIITPNVVEALQLDDERRRKLVKKLAPGMLQKVALNFSGAVGSETYNHFESGKYQYFAYILRKEENN